MTRIHDEESPAIPVFDIPWLKDAIARLCKRMSWFCAMSVLDYGKLLAVTVTVASGAVYDLSVTSTYPIGRARVDLHMHQAYSDCFTRRATALSVISLVVGAETYAVLGDDE